MDKIWMDVKYEGNIDEVADVLVKRI